MEACGSAHHWARVISRYGHEVRLLPSAYEKPYVQRNKNHGLDAEGICEAVTRPTMRFVAVKSYRAAGDTGRSRNADPAGASADDGRERTFCGLERVWD